MLWTKECLCPLPVAPGHRWRPNPQCDAICWWSTHKWEDLPRKEVQENSLIPFTTWDTGIRWPSLSQEMDSHQTLGLVVLWSWDFPSFQNCKICLLVTPHCLWYFCYSNPNGLRYSMVPFVWSSRTGKSVETATKLVVAKGWGRVGGGVEVGC